LTLLWPHGFVFVQVVRWTAARSPTRPGASRLRPIGKGPYSSSN